MVKYKRLWAVGQVRYINILTWLRGFEVKLIYLVLFTLYPSLFLKSEDKGNMKKLQFWPTLSENCSLLGTDI